MLVSERGRDSHGWRLMGISDQSLDHRDDIEVGLEIHPGREGVSAGSIAKLIIELDPNGWPTKSQGDLEFLVALQFIG